MWKFIRGENKTSDTNGCSGALMTCHVMSSWSLLKDPTWTDNANVTRLGISSSSLLSNTKNWFLGKKTAVFSSSLLLLFWHFRPGVFLLSPSRWTSNQSLLTCAWSYTSRSPFLDFGYLWSKMCKVAYRWMRLCWEEAGSRLGLKWHDIGSVHRLLCLSIQHLRPDRRRFPYCYQREPRKQILTSALMYFKSSCSGFSKLLLCRSRILVVIIFKIKLSNISFYLAVLSAWTDTKTEAPKTDVPAVSP